MLRLDRSEIACHHVLSNSSREFLDCFPRLPKHIRPELEALPNNVTGWVELVLHECSDLVNGEFVGGDNCEARLLSVLNVSRD